MTSHIYLAVGMWDEVVAANEQAARVAAERARAAGRAPSSCGHTHMWLMYGYLQQNRPADARRILDGCRAQATVANGLVANAPEQDPLDPDNPGRLVHPDVEPLPHRHRRLDERSRARGAAARRSGGREAHARVRARAGRCGAP